MSGSGAQVTNVGAAFAADLGGGTDVDEPSLPLSSREGKLSAVDFRQWFKRSQERPPFEHLPSLPLLKRKALQGGNLSYSVWG